MSTRRESLIIDIRQRLKGEVVVAALRRICEQRRVPNVVFCDNGSEFTGHIFDPWAYYHRVRIDFSRHGMPTDNAFSESLNGTFRDECLNSHWFVSLAAAEAKIEAWRKDYNETQPHRDLNNLAHKEFAAHAVA